MISSSNIAKAFPNRLFVQYKRFYVCSRFCDTTGVFPRPTINSRRNHRWPIHPIPTLTPSPPLNSSRLSAVLFFDFKTINIKMIEPRPLVGPGTLPTVQQLFDIPITYCIILWPPLSEEPVRVFRATKTGRRIMYTDITGKWPRSFVTVTNTENLRPLRIGATPPDRP